MKTLDELDALHAAATAGEWVVRSYQEPSGEFSPAPSWDVYDEDNIVLTAALHNAWPAFSARLRAAEAEVERLSKIVGVMSTVLGEVNMKALDEAGFGGTLDLPQAR